jgi:protein-S-isoprenylcysteine O-methyltransferase Ste14
MPAVIAVGLLASGWPAGVAGVFKVVGAVLAFAGGAVLLFAARALGSNLTPFPRPVERGEVTSTGPYAVVRHPIYSGGVLFFVGFGLAFSPWALGPALLLAVVWGLKAVVEERFLRTRYPGYAEYTARTRYRLFPYVY